MMNLFKFGAIDIGSNAVRLFIANIIEEENGGAVITKSSIHRIPVRLGEDVFTTGEIGEIKAEKLLKTIQAFNLIMDVLQVKQYRACATSAMREARNAAQVVDDIYKQTGIKIEIISVKEEASLLYRSRKLNDFKSDCNYLSMDLGGGCMDLTLFNLNETIDSASFKTGTIRMLNSLVDNNELLKLKDWLIDKVNKHKHIRLIGTGGNINKLFKLAQIKKDNPISYKKLKNLLKFLSSYDYDERMKVVELNPDRADVIIPAAQLFVNIMDWTGIKEIYVPVVGLVDGIVADEYAKYRTELRGIPFVEPLDFKISSSE